MVNSFIFLWSPTCVLIDPQPEFWQSIDAYELQVFKFGKIYKLANIIRCIHELKVSLGNVINPDRLINLCCDRITFLSTFFIRIFGIKSNCHSEIDSNESGFNQNDWFWSTLIKKRSKMIDLYWNSQIKSNFSI